METYNGQVRTPTDAIILFEACRLGLLPRVQRRLSEKERQSIRSGSVFVWDEREAGMRRWTDGKSWSASRVSGSFLTYREMEGKRGGSTFVTPSQARGGKTLEGGRNSTEDGEVEEGPDGYRYKPDGLMKQSFSITTNGGQHLHLISYYSRGHPTANSLRQPSNDPSLAQIQIPQGMYPESSVNDQSNTPAVTRSPMPGAPNYVMAPSPAYGRQPPPLPAPPYGYYPGFIPHPAGYMYPISPMHTPPGYALHPYPHSHPHALPPPGHPGSPYGPPPPPPLHQAPPPPYDQRPPRMTPGGGILTTSPGGNAAPAGAVPATQSPPKTPLYGAPGEQAAPPPQIDPRLTEPASTSVPPAETTAGAGGQPDDKHSPSAPRTDLPLSTASLAPTIGALVNDTTATDAPPQPQPPVTQASQSPAGRDGGERHASRSPGNPQLSVPAQDIPSEKLGFREDMRVVGQLNRSSMIGF